MRFHLSQQVVDGRLGGQRRVVEAAHMGLQIVFRPVVGRGGCRGLLAVFRHAASFDQLGEVDDFFSICSGILGSHAQPQ